MLSRIFLSLAIPATGFSLVGCTSGGPEAIANGLIAAAIVEGVDPVTGTIGASDPATFTVTVVPDGDDLDTDPDAVTVRWNSGPLAGTTRTFTFDQFQGAFGEFEYSNPSEEGVLFVGIDKDAGFGVGAVRSLTGDDAAVGLAHFGTPATNIPTTGEVAYVGQWGGFVVNHGAEENQLVPVTGDAEIMANFGSGTVSGQLLAPGDIFSDDIMFQGMMSYGRSRYETTTVQYGQTPATGTVIGGFYGDGAPATAGVFDVQTTNGDLRTMGGFKADIYQ